MRKFIYIFLILSAFACSNSANVSESAPQLISSGEYHYKESSVLWQQTSAEYRALCYQAFNVAMGKFNSRELDDLLSSSDKPAAVIMDLDETILDNSPYNGELVHRMQNYDSKTWKAWTDKAEAELVPGAKEFIQMVNSSGIALFYISNRKIDELQSTIQNLNLIPIFRSLHERYSNPQAKRE